MNLLSHSIRFCCIKCHKEINFSNFNNHCSICKGVINKPVIEYPLDLKCPHCKKQLKNNNSWLSHVRLCKENPNRAPSPYGTLGKKGTNQYIKAAKLGLPIPKQTEESKQKTIFLNKTRVWDEVLREKHSIAMRNVVKKYPDSYSKNNVCGRVKRIEYKNYSLKGTWELNVAKWLDAQNILWEYEINPHDYFWNNRIHSYFPDFYLSEYNVYIEVKGIETDRDRAKWEQFNDDLVIIDKRSINKINDYDISHVIKNFMWSI